MTIISPLPRALIKPAAPTAVLRLTRQSVTPLSPTAFLRPRELFCEALRRSGAYSWLVHPTETRAV
jgi:hypothetical protein